MLDTEKIDLTKIAARYGTLSKPLMDALDSADLLAAVRSICQRESLNDEQILIANQLVSLVILGFLEAKELAPELARHAGIKDPVISNRISHDINKSVFVPISALLKYRGYDEDQVKPVEIHNIADIRPSGEVKESLSGTPMAPIIQPPTTTSPGNPPKPFSVHKEDSFAPINKPFPKITPTPEFMARDSRPITPTIPASIFIGKQNTDAKKPTDNKGMVFSAPKVVHYGELKTFLEKPAEAKQPSSGFTGKTSPVPLSKFSVGSNPGIASPQTSPVPAINSAQPMETTVPMPSPSASFKPRISTPPPVTAPISPAATPLASPVVSPTPIPAPKPPKPTTVFSKENEPGRAVLKKLPGVLGMPPKPPAKPD